MYRERERKRERVFDAFQRNKFKNKSCMNNV